MKEKNFKRTLKTIKKEDFYTIGLLLSGFLISNLDFDTLYFFKDIFSVFNKIWFTFSYLVFSMILVLSMKYFIKNIDNFRVKDSRNILSLFKVFLLGYFIGFLVTIANSITINFFERLQI